METDREQKKHVRAKTHEESGVLETGQGKERARERKREARHSEGHGVGMGPVQRQNVWEREQDRKETH